MKLNYKADESEVTVLVKSDHRVEFHLGRLDDELFNLVMLSGPDQQLPQKSKVQGPYHTASQAQAAIKAIVQALQSEGYANSNGEQIWRIQAQAKLKENRKIRAENPVDTRFVPLGIPPES